MRRDLSTRTKMSYSSRLNHWML